MTNLGIICSGSGGGTRYVQVYITSVFILEPDRIVRMSLICDFSNVVAFGHNELRRPKAVNSLAVTSKKCCGQGHNELWQPEAANEPFATLIWPQ